MILCPPPNSHGEGGMDECDILMNHIFKGRSAQNLKKSG